MTFDKKLQNFLLTSILILLLTTEMNANPALPLPLPKIVDVQQKAQGCRVKVYWETNRQVDTGAHPPILSTLRVYIKKDGRAVLEPLAVLEYMPTKELPLFPYKLTGGSALKSLPPKEPHSAQESEATLNCKSLIGKIAVYEERDPYISAQRAAKNIDETKSGQGEATLAVKPFFGPNNKPENWPLPSEDSSKPAPAETEPTESKPVETSPKMPLPVEGNQRSPRLLSFSAGALGALAQYSGLYIDANIDTSLIFIGPLMRVMFFPVALFGDSIGENTVSMLKNFALKYETASLESARDLIIKRDGQNVGKQESSLKIQSLSIDYEHSYFGDFMQSGISIIGTSTQNLRHSAQFEAGISGAGASLRDLKHSCSGAALWQGFGKSNATSIPLNTKLGISFCLASQAETPAITTADFPNTSTQFDDSQQLAVFLHNSYALKEGPSGWLLAFAHFDFTRWVGSLTLSDSQVIDGSANIFSTSLGIESTF